MKPLSLQEARRLALASGATLEVGGQVFNAERAKAGAAPKPIPAVEAPKPAVPAEPPEMVVKIADVAKLLADRDAAWSAELDKLRSQFAAQAATHQRPPVQWSFKPKYDGDRMLKEIVATPIGQ